MAASYLPFLLTAVLCVVTGRGICRRLGLPSAGPDGYAWATALGTGATSMFLFAVAAVRGFAWLPEGPARLAFVAAPAVLATLVGRGGAPRAPLLRETPPAFSRWAIPAIVVGAFLVLSSLGPETGEDALDYHLPAAARVVREGLGPFVGCLDAEYRLGFDLLWVPGIVAGQPLPCGTAVPSALCSTALAAAVFAEVRRRANPAVAGVTATLLLLAPVVADYAVLGFVDAAVALYGFLALSAVAAYAREERSPWTWVVLSGVLAGLAAGAKLSGAWWVLIVPLALRVGLWSRRGGDCAAWVSLAAGVWVAAPWFVRSWVVMGNPLFPVSASRLGAGWADAEAVRTASRAVLDQTGLPRGPFLGLAGTWRVVFDPALGFDGPAWVLALLPAALVVPNTSERRALIGGGLLAWAAWAWFVPVARFGLGAWAWGAVAAGVGAARIAAGGRAYVAALAALALLVAAIDGRVVALRSGERVGTVLGIVDPIEHLRRRTPAEREQAEIAQDLPGPVGVTVGGTAWAGEGAVSLAIKRCGMYGPKDLSSPPKLLAVCRRAGIRSIVIPPDPKGWILSWQKAAEAWRAAGKASVGVRMGPGQSEWTRVILEDER